MSPNNIFSGIMIVILTVITGYADAQGAIWASKIWENDRLNPDALWRAGLGFGVGIAVYFVMLRFLRNVGVVTPEVQTGIYMIVMLVTVALVSRAFFTWQLFDQILGVALVLGMIWLSIRTASAA